MPSLISLEKNYAPAYSGLGWNYYQLREYELGKKNFEKALKIDNELESAKRGYNLTMAELNTSNT